MPDTIFRQYDPSILHRLQEAEVEVLKAFDAICREQNLNYFVHYGALLGALRHGGPIPWDDDIDVAMLRKDFEAFVAYCDAHPDMDYAYADPAHTQNTMKTIPIFYKKGTVFAENCSGWKPGISIDIFPFDHVSDDRTVRAREIKRGVFVRRLMYLCYQEPRIPLEGWKYYTAKAVCRLARAGLLLLRVKGDDVFKYFEKRNQAIDEKHGNSPYLTSFFSLDPTKSLLNADQFETTDIPFSGSIIRGPKDPDGLLTKYYGDYMQLPPEEKRVNHCPAFLDFGDGRGNILDN